CSRAPPTPSASLVPYTTLFRSQVHGQGVLDLLADGECRRGRRRRQEDVVALIGAGEIADDQRPGLLGLAVIGVVIAGGERIGHPDRKSTRLNSSHVKISYAVFC